MKRTHFYITAFLLLSVVSYSQNNKNLSVGFRIGDPFGLSIKKYTGDKAFELNIGRSFYYNNGAYRYGKYKYDEYFYKKYSKNTYVLTKNYIITTAPITTQLNFMKQKELNGLEGLELYFGLGGQFRFFNVQYENVYNNSTNEFEHIRIMQIDAGIDGFLGAEYSFQEIPLTIFADFGMFLEIYDVPFWPWMQGGFGVRYNF